MFDIIIFIPKCNGAFSRSGALFIIFIINFFIEIINSKVLLSLNVLFIIISRIYYLTVGIIILRSVFIKISVILVILVVSLIISGLVIDGVRNSKARSILDLIISSFRRKEAIAFLISIFKKYRLKVYKLA